MKSIVCQVGNKFMVFPCRYFGTVMQDGISNAINQDRNASHIFIISPSPIIYIHQPQIMQLPQSIRRIPNIKDSLLVLTTNTVVFEHSMNREVSIFPNPNA